MVLLYTLSICAVFIGIVYGDSSCDTANVWADCDNELFVYLKDGGGSSIQIGHEDNWHLIWSATLSDINASTVIEFKCVDAGVIGAFIATIEYNNVLYSTTNPITNSNFRIVESDIDTSSLVYHTKTSAPWHNNNQYIAPDASWVWNHAIRNTITFDFAFQNIMSPASNNASALVCNCNEDCVIDCDAMDHYNGCSNSVIDGRQASSLKVICKSSKNKYYGGCQLSTIYCPQGASSQCNIECKDYYACYLANIYSSYQYAHGSSNGNVSVVCHSEQGSCLKTTLYANNSLNAEIKCHGAGILGSKQHSACDTFNIHAEDVRDRVSVLCREDYSCYKLYLYARNAHHVSIHARGDLALSTSDIDATNAEGLDLFCGSEASEYGCHNVRLYSPGYKALGMPRSRVTCHGHGCFGSIFFYSAHAALDLEIALNGCGECNDIASCIGNWYFYCDSGNKNDVLDGDACTTDDCDCSAALNMVHTNWQNSLHTCDIFTFDFECMPDLDCVVDCMKLWPHQHGCYDKAINGQNASSLTVICNSSSVYGGCESAHIYCPLTDASRCNVVCSGKDSCYDTEISVANPRNSALYLKCRDSDSCSHSAVYGAPTSDIYIHCIATDSCAHMNVSANAAENVTVHCEGNAELRSYGACDAFNIAAQNVTNQVRLVCNGDYSCYSIHVFANSAHQVVVDSIGNFASFGGAVYAQYANEMFISCQSQYNEFGCYKMEFYIPEAQTTALHCEGHGCHYLDLFARNGYNDLLNISMNGCGECAPAAKCISHWGMACGNEYALPNSFDGDTCHYGASCGCNVDSINAQIASHWLNDASQCNLIHPDRVCNDGRPCMIDCSATDCSHDVIFGANASSLTVQCGEGNCNSAKIYCPTRYHSRCVLECSASKSCEEAEIYGEKESILYLKCDEAQSCHDIAVDVSNTFESTINCTAYDACGSLTLYGDNASHITLGCYGAMSGGNGYYPSWIGNESYWNASHHNNAPVCGEITVHAQHARTIDIHCVGNDVCSPALIDVSNAHQVSIRAVGSYSIYGGSVDAHAVRGALSLHFESIGSSSHGVEQIALHLPPNHNTYLNCIGYGCRDLRLYAPNGGMRDVFANLSFWGCNQCMKPEICISEWYLYCSGDTDEGSVATFTGSVCQQDDCHCNELKDEVEESFILDVEDEFDKCSFKPDLVCDADKSCVIDCGKKSTKCENKVIYGGQASSLTVLCSADFACNWVEIYCPETVRSQCNVVCTGFDTCYSSTVYGDHHNIITVQSAAQYAFEYSTVYAYDAIQVNVTCSAPESCYKTDIYASKASNAYVRCDLTDVVEVKNSSYDWYFTFYNYESVSPCYGLNIYAFAVAHDVYLQCAGDYACYSTNLYAHDAHHVAIIGDNGEYAMEDATIYAANATHLDLTCRGIDNNYGCSYLSIYLPQSAAASLSMKCFGFGCDNLYLYSKYGFADILNMQLQIHSCGGVCSDVAHCIDAWQMYCDQWSQFDVFTVFDGVSCTKHPQQCDCRQLQTMRLLKSAFIKDDTSQCNHSAFITTSSTTATTTAVIISHTRPPRPPRHSKGSEAQLQKKDTLSIFILVISVIVFLCIVANIYYCYRKRVNEKIAHQILEEAEEGGIQEIALEPMSANIGQQMNIVSVKDGTETRPMAHASQLQQKKDEEPKDGNNTETMPTISAYALATH